MNSKDYVGIANQYIEDILKNRTESCQYVKHACLRQQRDLEKQDFKYHFSEAAATRICKFAELMPHVKGRWAGTNIVLEPWQVFNLTTIFGWLDENEYRRYRIVYIEIPRKNAKSTLGAVIGIYLTCADGEPGAEVYSAATTKDQAAMVHDTAMQMAKRTPGLLEKFGLQTSAYTLYVEQSASYFKKLAREQGGNLDGLNIHGAIIDELHAHKTRDVYDVIETGIGSRTQPLIVSITTAGFNRAGICYEIRDDTKNIIDPNNSVEDDRHFGIIYTVDDKDDWTVETSLQKANPNWGVSVNKGDIINKARKAMRVASAQNNFLTKHLNVWVNAGTAWMNMIEWDKQAQTERTIEDFQGQRCHVSVDMAFTKDIAAISIMFEEDGIYYEFHRYYLPEAEIELSENSQYSGWEIDGYLIASPGNTIDTELIESELENIYADYDVLSIAFDPHQVRDMMQRLLNKGLPIVEYKNITNNMSPPMKKLEALVLEGKFKHDGCPLLTWMMSNVICHANHRDQIFPRKENQNQKIDGVVAILMVLGRWMVDEDISASIDEMINDPIFI